MSKNISGNTAVSALHRGSVKTDSTNTTTRMKRAHAMPSTLESPDHILGAVLLALLGIGTVMVFSSSTVIASAKFSSPAYFVIRHSLHLLVGFVVFAVAYRFPVERLRKLAPMIILVAVILLLLTLLVGNTHKGAQRWLSIAGVSFQPSEFAKFALILFLAERLSRQQERLRSFVDGLLPHLVIIGIVLALIVAQPDLSTAIAIALISGVVFIAARVRMRHLLLLGSLLTACITLAVSMEPYRMSRITGFLGGTTAIESNYQIHQGFVAMGSGGLFGRGLGRSLQKYFFLPEPYTDSVFPIIGEEFGFIGTLAVLGLFAAFGWRAMLTIKKQQTLFRFLLATGLAANVMVYASLNIMVMTGLLPATGLPLPFISYGGTALLVNLAGVAVLFRLSRANSGESAAEVKT